MYLDGRRLQYLTAAVIVVLFQNVLLEFSGTGHLLKGLNLFPLKSGKNFNFQILF